MSPSPYSPNDKVLHLVTFFFLTLVFYFILDTSRRRVLNLTLVVCTVVLGVGSEVVQGFLPNGRTFDPYDILANVVGSLSATGLASWYHKRMLDRRRKTKFSVLGQEGAEEDVELGEGSGLATGDGEQETGIVRASQPSLEEEVDNWDENAADDDWNEDDLGTAGNSTGKMTPPSSSAEDDHEVKLAKD